MFFKHELELLLENNLIKGGDINNAIVIVENKIDKRKLSNFAKVFDKNDIQITESGILNNLKLRHKNEAARHKLLDVIGDLALIGFPIKAKITAMKPGHTHNTNFAKKIRDLILKDMRTTAPLVDFNEKPFYNKQQIKEILPQRSFLIY